MLAFLVRLLLRLLYRVEVQGTVEPHPRLLIISNHVSYLDGVLLGAFLPVRPVWLVHTAIAAHWYYRWPLKLVRHLVVDTTSPWAIKTVVELIEAGTPVLIFPEGRVTVTGSRMKLYDGPAFAAARTGAQVVPVHLRGPEYTHFGRVPYGFPRKLFPRFRITVFPPRVIAMPDLPKARLRRRAASEAMRRIMQRCEVESRPAITLFESLLEAAALHGRRRRFLEDVTQPPASFARVIKISLALGRMVSKLAPEGGRVGVLLPNVSTTACLLLGMLAMRRVAAMLNYTSGAEGIENACQAAGVRLVLSSRAFLERARLEALPAKLRAARMVFLEDLRPRFGLRDKLWLMLWAVRFPRLAARPARPEEEAFVLFTSGSEGRPKGVVLSHAAILANAAQVLAVIDVAPSDKFLSALPLFHAFGLTVGVFLPLLAGSRVFLYPSPLHYRMIPEMAYDRDCTILFATNTFLANYARCAHPYDFRSLRLLGAGAEKLTEEVRQLYLDRFGIRIVEGYGATECAPVVSLNVPMAYKAGTVGQLLPGVEHRLEPVEGIEGGGLLHVRGPNLMLGYLRAERPGVLEPPRSVFGEGWYNTGDVVSVDEQGFVTILARLRRFAKVAGEMVSLELVERLAAAASPGRQHAAVARRESARGESIVLFTEDPGLRREMLIEAARKLGAGEIAAPRRVVRLERIPLLASGKKDYLRLGQMAQELA